MWTILLIALSPRTRFGPPAARLTLPFEWGLTNIFLVLVVFFTCVSSGPLRAATASKHIAFYDPDTNYQSILAINSWFNKFLQSVHTDSKLQVLQNRETFEEYLAAQKPGFAVVSSTYLLSSPVAELTPLLVPSDGNSVFYQKLLVDRGQCKPKDLSGITIAVTTAGENPKKHSKKVLSLLQEKGFKVKGTIVVSVSKDIDALLGLAFGQVEAALITNKSIEVMKRINPNLVASLRVLFRTRPILRAPLCAVKNYANQLEHDMITTAILTMGETKAGRKSMALLGIDKWIWYKPSMLPNKTWKPVE